MCYHYCFYATDRQPNPSANPISSVPLISFTQPVYMYAFYLLIFVCTNKNSHRLIVQQLKQHTYPHAHTSCMHACIVLTKNKKIK